MDIRFVSNKDWDLSDIDTHSGCKDFAAFVQTCAQSTFVGIRIDTSPPNGDLLWMATDPRLTAPIYYRQDSSGYLFGSTGWDLLAPGDTLTSDADAQLFYRRWGITHGDHSLYNEIKRVPPSAAVCISADGRTDLCYYDTIALPIETERRSQTYNEAKEGMIHLFEQMAIHIASQAEGKQIILPLTGGRDSRLLAYCLKLGGLENVLCITYGKEEGNADLSKARIIAKQLGYKHRYIPSVPPDLPVSSYIRDKEFLLFARYLAGLGSCYFYQEYQPGKLLQQEGLLSTDTLVLTGHNGDVLGGGLLIYPDIKHQKSDACLARVLMLHGNTNTHLSQAERKILWHIHKDLVAKIEGTDPWRKLEIFLCREFVSKYYTNSGRAWRYFGANIYHPYTDNSLIRWAHSLPFECRYGKRLYDEVTDILFDRIGISLPDDDRQLRTQSGRVYRLKMSIRPYCAPYLFRQENFGHDNIGFERLMAPLAEEVHRDGRYQPLSFNGLSFAWYLLNLQRLRML